MTLAVFFYLYLVVLAIFGLYSIFNIYHLMRFGFLSFTNVAVIIAYISISTAMIMANFALFGLIDWQQPLFASPDTFESQGTFYGE